MEYKVIQIAPLTKIPLDKNQVFSYKINSQVKTYSGQVAIISFAGRSLYGVVFSDELLTTRPKSFDISKLKEIDKFADEDVALTEGQLKLALWMHEQYISPLGLCLKLMLVKKVKITKANQLYFNSKEKRDSSPTLNPEQLVCVEEIKKSLDYNKVFLLRGITGSGKTEIYMEIIQKLISNNRQAIMLVPEISLTPQAIKRFAQRFGASNLAILHSRLSPGEKYQNWQRIKTNQAKIIIGPRSAIFAPVKNLGAIILDEEHDSSYKQYDQNPRYHAKNIALHIGKTEKIPVILGSATPSIESYYQAEKKFYQLIEMKKRFKSGLNLPPVNIIDMREELKKGNFSLFSEELENRINEVYERGKQTLLFVNRRGVSTFVMCRDCGYVVECPNCSVSLTYHAISNKQTMICHHCNYQEEVKVVCPKCDSKYIKYFGVGTQRVEQELYKIVPQAKILRMDRDTMNNKDDHLQAFHKFAQNKYHILVGTQMITKGIDLSNIELVGIIASDALFNFPDFRTNERAFQSITQVSGRTSRQSNSGKVVLQTYNPDNFVLKYASKHDYIGFFNKEIALRKELQYPPYKKLIKLVLEGSDYAKLADMTMQVAQKIKKALPIVEIIGPSPAFIVKKRSKYIWNIIIKYNKDSLYKQLINLIPAEFKIDVDPEDLL